MTDKRYIKYKIQDLVLEEIERMTVEQVKQRLEEIEEQYLELRQTQFKTISDCKTFEEVEKHVKHQFEMLKLEAMYEKYHYELQFL